MEKLREGRFSLVTQPKLMEVAQVLKNRLASYYLHVNYFDTLVEVGRRTLDADGSVNEVVNYLVSLCKDGAVWVKVTRYLPDNINCEWSSTFAPSLTPAEVADGIPDKIPNLFE